MLPLQEMTRAVSLDSSRRGVQRSLLGSLSPGVLSRARYRRSRALPSDMKNEFFVCVRCRQAPATIRCLDCPSTGEGSVMCARCARYDCDHSHTRTRVFYQEGEALECARNDEHRHREYKSILHYLAHRKGSRAIDLVRKKVARYINGFVNSGGGVILFGIDELRHTGEVVVERVVWTRADRTEVRRFVETCVRAMQPPVSSSLYYVAFVPIKRHSQCYVLEIHVSADPKGELHCMRRPRCFTELCEAYERHDESTTRLSPSDVSRRLGVLAVPPPLDFRYEATLLSKRLDYVARRQIDDLVRQHLARRRESALSWRDLTSGMDTDRVVPDISRPAGADDPPGLLLLGDAGTGKTVWSASHIRDSVALDMKARILRPPQGLQHSPGRKRGSGLGGATGAIRCFECEVVFPSKRKLHKHLIGGWCPLYIARKRAMGLPLPKEFTKAINRKTPAKKPNAKTRSPKVTPTEPGDGSGDALNRRRRLYRAADIIDAALIPKGYYANILGAQGNTFGAQQRTRTAVWESEAREDARAQQRPAIRLIAHHVCLARDGETVDSGRFVRSIAAQIARSNIIGNVHEALGAESVEYELAEHRASQNPLRAMEKGLLRPLRELSAPSCGQLVLLVDGLDECIRGANVSDYDRKEPQREGGGGIDSGRTRSGSFAPEPSQCSVPELLAACVDRFPPWIVLVCTSRYRKEVQKLFSPSKFDYLHMADASDADMSRFVSQRLKRLALSSEDKSHRSRVAVPGVASAICTMAGANFLYASMVLGALEKGTLKPKSLLMSLNGGDHATADKGLAGMYTDSFQRIFARPADYNGNRINPCRALLEVLLAANRPLSQVSLDSSLAYCANATQTLRVYLHSSGTGEGSMEADSSEPTWKIFHSSLADWLTEQGGAAGASGPRGTQQTFEKHPYHCNVGRGHALLAVGLLRRLFKTAGMRGPVRRSGAESAIRRWLGEGLSLHLPVDSPELPTPVAPSVVYDVAFHLAMATSLAGFPSGAHLLDRLRMATVSTRRVRPNFLDAADGNGRTAVFLACQADGSLRVLRLLLQARASTRASVAPQALSPLHIAARRTDPTLVRLLVSARASIDQRSHRGRTPLMVAAGKGFTTSVRYMLASGRATDTLLCAQGCNAFHYAARAGHLRVLDLLLENAKRVAAKYDEATVTEPRPVAKSLQARPGGRQRRQGMGLVQCLRSVIPGGVGGLVAARICARHGVSREGTWLELSAAATGFLVSAFYNWCSAARQVRGSGTAALQNGAPGEALATVTLSTGVARWLRLRLESRAAGCGGATPLFEAVRKGKWRVVKLLLLHGADARVCATAGGADGPALWHASDTGHLGIIRALVRARADVNAAAEVRWDATGTRALQTALYSACSSKLQAPRSVGSGNSVTDSFRWPLAKLLVELKADANLAESLDGRTPLMSASWAGDVDAVRLLLSAHADANLTMKDGGFALLDAAFQGHVDVVQLLLNQRAEPNMVDGRGLTSLHCSAARGNYKVVELLLAHAGTHPTPTMQGGPTPLEMARASLQLLRRDPADEMTGGRSLNLLRRSESAKAKRQTVRTAFKEPRSGFAIFGDEKEQGLTTFLRKSAILRRAMRTEESMLRVINLLERACKDVDESTWVPKEGNRAPLARRPKPRENLEIDRDTDKGKVRASSRLERQAVARNDVRRSSGMRTTGPDSNIVDSRLEQQFVQAVLSTAGLPVEAREARAKEIFARFCD